MIRKHYSKEFIAQMIELYDAGNTIQEIIVTEIRIAVKGMSIKLFLQL